MLRLLILGTPLRLALLVFLPPPVLPLLILSLLLLRQILIGMPLRLVLSRPTLLPLLILSPVLLILILLLLLLLTRTRGQSYCPFLPRGTTAAAGTRQGPSDVLACRAGSRALSLPVQKDTPTCRA